LSLILLTWALPAHSMSVSGSLEISWRDYDARETAPNGFLLNHEQGDLPGIAVTLAADGPLGRWALHAAHEGGDVAYRGVSQFGLPVRTTTLLDVNRLAVRWAPAWAPRFGSVRLQPELQLTRQRIGRAIRPSQSSTALTEKLDALFIHGGLSVLLPLSDRWSLRVDGELNRSLALRLHVDTFGFYDDLVLRPAAHAAGRFGVAVSWQPAPDLRAAICVGREYWRFGASGSREVARDGVVVGSANYPGSHQRLDGISLRIEYLLLKRQSNSQR
jgi:hypothetical protein